MDFANPDRHGVESRSIVCPIDLYENTKQFYDKIKRTEGNRCGEVMQDVKGTLQGDWFTGRGTFQKSSGWRGLLAFVHSNDVPSVAVISIGGVISEPAKREFTEKTSGLTNRKFTDVTADGNIYCYVAEAPIKEWEEKPTGKILVQMTSDTELQIEHQSGSCPGSFNTPTVYNR